MDGKELIKYICAILEKQNKRLYDSNIVAQLSQMSQYEIEALMNKSK